jgi:hypothetical protein
LQNCSGERDAGTRTLLMARPRIGRIGVDHSRDFIEQTQQVAFPHLIEVEPLANGESVRGIKHRLAADSIRTGSKRFEILRDPGAFRSSIGIGGQDHAAWREHCGVLPGQPARFARGGFVTEQRDADNFNAPLLCLPSTTNICCGVCTIVKQKDKSVESECLCGQRIDACANMRLLIFYRNCDNDRKGLHLQYLRDRNAVTIGSFSFYAFKR